MSQSAPHFIGSSGDWAHRYRLERRRRGGYQWYMRFSLRRHGHRLRPLRPVGGGVAGGPEVRARELRFHPEDRPSAEPDGAYLARGRSALLRIEPLTTEGVEVLASDTPARARGEAEGRPRRNEFLREALTELPGAGMMRQWRCARSSAG